MGRDSTALEGSRSIPANPTLLDELIARVHASFPDLTPLCELLQITAGRPNAAEELARFSTTRDARLSERLGRLAETQDDAPADIEEAIERKGFRHVHSAAVASTLIGWFATRDTTHIDALEYWRGAAATGILAGLTATVERANEDYAFTAGLMHQIGLLLLDLIAPDRLGCAIERSETEDIPIGRTVHEEIGFTHCMLSGVMAIRWGLPGELVEACAYPPSLTDALHDPRSLRSLVYRGALAGRVRGYGPPFDDEIAEQRDMWLIERPLLHLERLGGQLWLRQRVDALLATALLADD